MGKSIETEIKGIVTEILEDYKQDRAVDKMEDIFNMPDKDKVTAIVHKLMKIILPGYYRDKAYKIYNIDSNISVIIEDVIYHLSKQIAIALKYDDKSKGKSEEELREEAERLTIAFFKTIPSIRAKVETDLQAAFDGDPAARSKDEVVFSYPGFFAIEVSRIAHELFLLGVPMIPRIMTEYAHGMTGIDIHPGATIGEYFFIDHGTGIVIGETTLIGNNVKIYQGVTLGALSTRGGQKLKGIRRHPTIEDNVTIYSGASILGGETIIGHDSVIGGNVFITKPVKPGTRVSVKNQELIYKSDETDEVWANELR
ncbi:MAG: serine acetyltransferase [Lachnospiraceae bacterium]|nr:serine acetyltransferase [Lachnospiraceae bacterium]